MSQQRQPWSQNYLDSIRERAETSKTEDNRPSAGRWIPVALAPADYELFQHAAFDLLNLLEEIGLLKDEVKQLRAAVAEHHSQKAEDRCIEDDDRLYAAFGLPPCDRRVGSKAEMHANCWRFISQRCESGGPWKSYRELEEEIGQLKANIAQLESDALLDERELNQAHNEIERLRAGLQVLASFETGEHWQNDDRQARARKILEGKDYREVKEVAP